MEIQYIIIGVILIIILLAVLKAGKKDAHLELNKLVEYLGGKENIISTEINMSRFKATLKAPGSPVLHYLPEFAPTHVH